MCPFPPQKMSIRALVSFVLLLPFLSGCAVARPAPSASARPPVSPGEQARGALASQSPSVAQRLLVRRVWLLLEAEKPAALAAHAEQIATAAGGHVETLVLDEGERLRAVLRIPADRLEGVVAALERLGEVEEKRVAAADVTEENADLEARLRTLVAVRDRLRQHLERAEGVPDLLTLEREIARVQSEIEILESRLERLRTGVALAEVTLEARQERILGPLGRLGAGIVWAISKLFVIRW